MKGEVSGQTIGLRNHPTQLTFNAFRSSQRTEVRRQSQSGGRAALRVSAPLVHWQCRFSPPIGAAQSIVIDSRFKRSNTSSGLRLAVAGHRVHGRLPGVHLGRRAVPRPVRDAGPAGRTGLPGDHDHRPRGQVRPGLLRSSTPAWSGTCSAAPRAATSISARSGRATPPSPTSSPRRPGPGGAS